MSCIELPAIDIPDIVLDLLPSLDLEVPVPTIGIALCCTLSTPPLGPIIISFAAIPTAAVLLGPVNAAIQAAQDTLNDALDLIQFECPLE